MRAAQQLDLAGDIGESGVDLGIRHLVLVADSERADLKEVELPVVGDGKFHVERVTREEGFKLAYKSYNRCKRRRAGVGPRFKAKKSLEIIADTGGHAIG